MLKKLLLTMNMTSVFGFHFFYTQRYVFYIGVIPVDEAIKCKLFRIEQLSKRLNIFNKYISNDVQLSRQFVIYLLYICSLFKTFYNLWNQLKFKLLSGSMLIL